MTKYDKIYVPHPRGDYEAFEIGFEDPERGRLTTEENVIVLTLEELRDCYNAGGADRCAIQEGNFSHSFDRYLENRGIKIP